MTAADRSANAYLLVGGSPEPSSVALVEALARQVDHVIAVDKGAELLERAAIRPWAFVGDADSVAEGAFEWARREAEVVRLHPVLKDATDLTLAFELVDEAEGRFLEDDRPLCLVTCVTGGRLDHQLGVVGTLAAASHLAPILVEDGACGWILSHRHAPEVVFGLQDVGRTVSVLALSAESCVSEEGMRWDLDHRHLQILDDLGVSNVVEAPAARVTCDRGIVFVIEVGEPLPRPSTRDEINR